MQLLQHEWEQLWALCLEALAGKVAGAHQELEDAARCKCLTGG